MTAHDIELELVRFSGARAVRIVDASGSQIGEHRHDWPILSLYTMGEYRKIADCGSREINCPSAILHPAGEYHASDIGEFDLEQVDIEFDPDWLGVSRDLATGPIRCWVGGPVGAAARGLAREWLTPERTGQQLAAITQGFLVRALSSSEPPRPRWFADIQRKLRANPRLTAPELAMGLNCSGAWFAQAYRAAAGEGLAEASRRHRVQRAVKLIGNSDAPLAEVALDAGFCDQSHMNRNFRTVLDRTPAEITRERRNAVG